MAGSENKITVTTIVSGQPTTIEVNVHQKVEHLIREALRGSGNQGQPPDEWELRSADGRLFEPGSNIESSGIVDGATLYLNPRAGAGGQ